MRSHWTYGDTWDPSPKTQGSWLRLRRSSDLRFLRPSHQRCKEGLEVISRVAIQFGGNERPCGYWNLLIQKLLVTPAQLIWLRGIEGRGRRFAFCGVDADRLLHFVVGVKLRQLLRECSPQCLGL